MTELHTRLAWTRHIYYYSYRRSTTWKFRLLVLAVLLITVILTRGWWSVAIGRGLVCDSRLVPSDAILIENFESEYLLFERAASLRQAGFSGRVLVPVTTDPRTGQFDDVMLGVTKLMANIAGLGAVELVPIREIEPISLNAARDVRKFVVHAGIRSLIVVSPTFRSRRSALVYTAVLNEVGVSVTCDPARSPHTVRNWAITWHGIQEVLEQWIKLQYYRSWVLPFRRHTAPSSN